MFRKNKILQHVILICSSLYQLSHKIVVDIFVMNGKVLKAYECQAHWSSFLSGRLTTVVAIFSLGTVSEKFLCN